MNTITITKKSVYGRDVYYPVNELAQQFCDLLKAKSFTVCQLKKLKDMDFKIEVSADTEVF